MIEAPTVLQNSLSIPQNHFDACKAQNIPIVGNAAGNDKDFLDLTGAPKPPDRLPDGFTARGIVALVFSILAALLGMAVISWSVDIYLPTSLLPLILFNLLIFSFPHSTPSPSISVQDSVTLILSLS